MQDVAGNACQNGSIKTNPLPNKSPAGGFAAFNPLPYYLLFFFRSLLQKVTNKYMLIYLHRFSFPVSINRATHQRKIPTVTELFLLTGNYFSKQ